MHSAKPRSLATDRQSTGNLVTNALRERTICTLSLTHFHNGFLTAAVETGTLGIIAVLSIFLVLIRNAFLALRDRSDPHARFGGVLLMSTAIVYFCMGSVNLMFGHDILDVMFMVMTILGIYLGLGRSALEKADPRPVD